MITLAHIVISVLAVLYLGVRIKLVLTRRHRRQLHEPRALKLLEAAKVESAEAVELRLKLMRPGAFVGPQSLAGAIMGGLARMDGTCTRCGGYWNESHGDAPHGTWNRPITMPSAGPGTRRRG